MMSLTFGLFTQVSGSGPLGPLVYMICLENKSVMFQEQILNINDMTHTKHGKHLKFFIFFFNFRINFTNFISQNWYKISHTKFHMI